MAKRRTITVHRAAPSPTIRISAPAPVSRRARVGRIVRRGASAAGGAVAGEKHTLLAVLAAFGFGYLEKSGQQLPSVAGFTPLETMALAFWAAGKWGKSKTAAHMGTGLLCVAANKWGRGETSQGVSGTNYVW